MATIGFDRLFYAPITEAADGSETYGTPASLAKAISAELSVELNEATLYADDGVAETVKEFKSGTLTLGIDDIGTIIANELTGAQIDTNHVLVSASENGGNPVAIGFRARKSDGRYKYFWLYRVKFGIPATNLQTKGDSITFSTPTIEGTIYRRNKLDGQNNHPWKAEANEGDTSLPANVITGWFTSVYEPSFTVPTVTITTQPQNATVTQGAITGDLTVAATASSSTLLYQWYSNTSASMTDGTAIPDATGASMTIPTDLTEGSYYYYCAVSAGATTVKTNAVTVTVSAGGEG